jgi:hypothetical protein
VIENIINSPYKNKVFENEIGFLEKQKKDVSFLLSHKLNGINSFNEQ